MGPKHCIVRLVHIMTLFLASNGYDYQHQRLIIYYSQSVTMLHG